MKNVNENDTKINKSYFYIQLLVKDYFLLVIKN